MSGGLASQVINDKTGEGVSVSTVARRVKSILPSGQIMITSFDIVFVLGDKIMALPIARVFIGDDCPQYVLPEIHQLMVQIAEEAKSLDHGAFEECCTAYGLVCEFGSMRDPWHKFKKLNQIFVTDMTPVLADSIVEHAAKRLADDMINEGK